VCALALLARARVGACLRVLVAAKVEQNMHRHLAAATMLIAINACSDAQPDDFNGFDELAAEAPPGKIALEAIAQPPSGGTATVSVQALGSTVCNAAVCIVDPFSTPTFTATPAAGFKFVSWTGCAFPSSNAVNAFPATVSSETCTANFESTATTPPPAQPPTAPAEPPPTTPAEPPPTTPVEPPVTTPEEPSPPDPVTAPVAPFPSPDAPLDPAEAKRVIDEKYASLDSGVTTALGFPTSEVQPAGLPDGAYRQFEGGRIYFNKNTKEAYFVTGAIYALWTDSEYLGITSADENTGLPITDELSTPDGRGRYQHFDWDESYYWTPEYGAINVSFAIRDAWAKQGWERSPAGFPKGAQTRSDGRCGGPNASDGLPYASYQEFEAGFFCTSVVEGTWFIPTSP
jgi:uncharacterized protein with LGFP repeats